MRRFQFNQIFGALFCLCLISAFVFPGAGRQSWGNVQVLFKPVARPAGQLAVWLIGPRNGVARDARKDTDIRSENQALKVEIAQLEGQLQAVSQLAAERRQLGGLLNFCVSTPVIGGDSDDHDALDIQQTSPPMVTAGQAVVCAQGLVGRVQSAGAGGAKVLLITDKSSRPVSVDFGRMVLQANGGYLFQRLIADHTPLNGRGNNELVAKEGLSLSEAKNAGLQPGDWAVLDDDDFPMQLAGMCVGQVSSVERSLTGPLYVDVVVRPIRNLSTLQEVLVMRF